MLDLRANYVSEGYARANDARAWEDCARALCKRRLRNRRLFEMSADKWQLAFYKERTFPLLCLTLIIFVIIRTTILIPLFKAKAYRYFLLLLFSPGLDFNLFSYI